jgi:hypothetical protein
VAVRSAERGPLQFPFRTALQRLIGAPRSRAARS